MKLGEIIEAKLDTVRLQDKVKQLVGKAQVARHESMTAVQIAEWNDLAKQLEILQTNVGQALRQVQMNGRNLPTA